MNETDKTQLLKTRVSSMRALAGVIRHAPDGAAASDPCSAFGWSGAIVGPRQTTHYGWHRGTRRGLSVIVSEAGLVRLAHQSATFGRAFDAAMRALGYR